MLKLPFLKQKKVSSQEQFLTLDIGTDYVKCLIFEFNPKDIPSLSVIGVGKQPLGYLHTRGGSIVDYEGVKHSCTTAISEARNMCDSKATKVIIGLSGEMGKGLVTTVRLTRAEPETPISSEEIQKIISKIQETAYFEASKEVAMMTGNPDLEIDLTNSSVSSVKIDGAYVKDPVGLIGRRMEIALFTSFSPSFHLKLLQKLSKELGLKILTITSALYALSKALYEKSEGANMVLMDIGGESTDVGIVFGGGIVATRTLSLGGRHVTRAIGEAFGLSHDDAEEIKLRYSLGTLNQEELPKVSECIKDVLSLWVSGVELLFSDFDGVKTFPSLILFVGGGSSLKDAISIIESEPWTKNIPFKEPPYLEKLLVKDISFVADKTGRVDGADQIMPVALSEVFFEIEGIKPQG